MSLNLGVMSAAVTLDDVEYRQKLSGMTGEAESTFKKIAGLAVAYLSGRALWGGSAAAVREFSMLEEARNRFENVFREIQEYSRKTAEALQRDFDLSEQSAKDMLAATGDLLTGFGFSAEAAMKLSDQAARLGADLASYTNYAGGAKGAALALTAAMLGETEQAKALGVVIRQDSEEFTALVRHYQKTENATLQQAKAMAVLQIATDQSKNAIGDWSRPGETLAQTQMKIAERTRTMTAAIGENLAQGVHPAAKSYAELLKWFNELDPAMQRLIVNGPALTAALGVVSVKTGMLSRANHMFEALTQTFAGGMQGQDAEKHKELSKTRSDAVRDASEKRRHYMELRNAAAEAQAVVTAEARKLAAARARVTQMSVLSKKAAGQDSLKNAGFKERMGLILANGELKTRETAMQKSIAAARQLSAAEAAARLELAHSAAAARSASAALRAHAAATTLAGRAGIVLSKGLNVAKAAAASLYAALGPMGVAMLVLNAGYLYANYLSEKHRNELEGEIAASEKAAQAANELAAAHSRARASDNSAMDRLQELSRYEKLNNSEKQEAEKLLKQLTDRYGDLGISIDKVTGKLKISTEALAEMNEQQAREYELDLTRKMQKLTWNIAAEQNGLRNELGTYWTNLLGGAWQLFTLGQGENILGENQNVLDDAMVLETTGKKIAALEKLEAQLTSANERDKASRVGELIKKLKEYQVLEKQQLEFQKTRKLNDPENRNGTSQNISEKTRKAQDSLAELEWDTRFNEADATAKARMLSEKIDGIFKRQSGKYRTLDEFKSADRNAMTEQELKDLQEIVQLEEQRRRLREQSAEAFSDERERYEQMLRDREERREAQAIEKQLRDARKSGDQAAVDAIMQQQLEKAQRAVRELQRQYEKAVRDAEADGIMTDEERRNLSRIWSDMQREMSDEDRWRREMERAGEEDHSTQRTIGGFSAEVLNAMLGGAGKPVEETAKNTRKMVELLKEKTKREIVELGA